MENEFGIIFDFNLYAVSLQVILVIYFRRKLGEPKELEIVMRCVVANTRRQCQFWLIFRIKLI